MVMYMDIANSVLELIGRTPMVRLVRVTEGIPCPVIAKVETTNPGGTKELFAASSEFVISSI